MGVSSYKIQDRKIIAAGPISPIPLRQRGSFHCAGTKGVGLALSVLKEATSAEKYRSKSYTPYRRPLRENLFCFVQVLVVQPCCNACFAYEPTLPMHFPSCTSRRRNLASKSTR